MEGGLKNICGVIIQSGLPITSSLMTRCDRVDEEMLELLGQAGCNKIDFGVESGHPETLRKIHQPHTIEMVKQIIPLTAN